MALHFHGSHPRAIPLSETIEAWVFLLGLAVSVWIVRSDVIASAIAGMGDYREVGVFAAGAFFTSILTTAPAIAALSEFALYMPAWQVALFGAMGSVVGDILIFRFVRSNLTARIVRAGFSPGIRLIGRAIAAGPLWWLGPLAGGIVIASPLPDELGLLMMGLSHIRTGTFIVLSFAANAVGIYAIVTLAQGL